MQVADRPATLQVPRAPALTPDRSICTLSCAGRHAGFSGRRVRLEHTKAQVWTFMARWEPDPGPAATVAAHPVQGSEFSNVPQQLVQYSSAPSCSSDHLAELVERSEMDGTELNDSA